MYLIHQPTHNSKLSLPIIFNIQNQIKFLFINFSYQEKSKSIQISIMLIKSYSISSHPQY